MKKKNMEKARIGLLKKKKTTTARIGLCDLPDEILVKILSLLPTKSALKTSILLSRRWHYLCTCITKLKLSEDMFRERSQFINFTDGAMALRKGSKLKSLLLECLILPDNASRLDAWITSAVLCNVENLTLQLDTLTTDNYVLPVCLFGCPSLVKLHLMSMQHCILRVPSSISFLSNVKCLKLSGVTLFADDESVEKLFSSPLLEELSICYCNWVKVRSIRVSTPKLKVLDITDDREDIVNHKVCFVADNLWSFCYKGSLYHEYQICASSPSSFVQLSTAKLDVLRSFHRDIVLCGNRFLKLMNSVSKAHSLTLGDLFVKALYKSFLEQDDTLPIFECLTRLNLECENENIHIDGIVLTKIFEKSPHLERLDIKEPRDVLMVSVLSPLPMCFRTHLKRIFIGNCGYHAEEEGVISILLKSCAVLEIMEINRLCVHGMHGSSRNIEKLHDKLNQRPRVSKDCRIVLNYVDFI